MNKLKSPRLFLRVQNTSCAVYWVMVWCTGVTARSNDTLMYEVGAAVPRTQPHPILAEQCQYPSKLLKMFRNNNYTFRQKMLRRRVTTHEPTTQLHI